jgi:hypothetical protein
MERVLEHPGIGEPRKMLILHDQKVEQNGITYARLGFATAPAEGPVSGRKEPLRPKPRKSRR